MNRRKRTLAITLLVLLLLFVPPFWITYREYRQARLDHALIEAIKTGNDQKALEALAEGASGEARDTGEPPTMKEAMLHLWERFRHPGKQDVGEHLPVLLLEYQQASNSALTHSSQLSDWGPGPNVILVRALLDHGAKVNEQNANGESPLLSACRFSDVDTVHLLLERGANSEISDRDGVTPLMYANVEIAKVLLDHGANIETVEKYQCTVLMEAVIDDDATKVNLLLEHNANVQARDAQGRTALNFATNYYDQTDPVRRKIASLLRHYGAK